MDTVNLFPLIYSWLNHALRRPKELYKGSGAALRDVLDTIDHYSSVQARIAGYRA